MKKNLLKTLRDYIPFLQLFGWSLAIFSFYRICFVVFNHALIPDAGNTFYNYFTAFRIGINFDTVTSCYLFSHMVLLIAIQQMSRNNFSRLLRALRLLHSILFALAFLICCADIPYYKQFGNHLNKEFLLWIQSPKIVMGLIFSNFMYWGFLLLFVAFLYLNSKVLKRIYSRIPDRPHSNHKGAAIIVFLIFGLLTFVGMRGRIAAKSPIRIGTAFFCEHAFFNQLGLNPCFVFIKSISEEEHSWPLLKENITATEAKAQALQAASNGYYTGGKQYERIYTRSGEPKKYNVVLVLMESMALSKMGYYNQHHLTSRFDSIVAHGRFYDHFFSAGIHTFNGLFSTETGFPSVMDIHPLNTYTEKSFKGIAYWLKQNKYSNFFFTCHDAQFDNMEGFMRFNDFDNVYSQADYPSSEVISTLGVPDHYLFDFALQKLNKQQQESDQPFFAYILTSSDHTPYALPDNIPFHPSAKSKEEQATQYADWALGHLIDEAKKFNWFNNTLFVFVADHGTFIGNNYAMPLAYHHIPCVFYMPSKIQPDTISSLGGQIDVLPTLMGELNIPFTNYGLGIDLNKESRPCMYFCADNKIGCIDQQHYYMHLYEENQELLYDYTQLSTDDLSQKLKSTTDSMRNYSHNFIKTANYLLKNKYY